MNLQLSCALSAALLFVTSSVAADIHNAVRKGDAATVERLLKESVSLVNLPDEEHGATPLYCAVDAGNLEMVRRLLKAGAALNVKTDNGSTPVLRAAAIADSEKFAGFLKVLLAFYGAPPGAKRAAHRETLKTFQASFVSGPEEEAARVGILQLLVEAGASLRDTMPSTEETPLHVAASFSNRKAVELLLAHGADVEASALGTRPLHIAALRGNAAVAKALIANKADVNARQLPAGARPLHFAVLFSGDLETVRLLLDNGAEVNAVNRAGVPALHGATWSDEVFNLLMERGANPKLRSFEGETTLHKAAQEGSRAVVEKLLQMHPFLDAEDGDGFTPLLNAAEFGRVDILKLLVESNAYLNATQRNGWNALHLAASSESPQAVQFLLDRGLGANELSSSGETALMFASSVGRLETVSLLLQAGAKVNLAERTQRKTALMCAAHGPVAFASGDRPEIRTSGPAADYLKIVARLLAEGASLHATDSEGKTALHHAAASGSPEVVELLIANGAEVDAKDTLFGRTPLHNAAYSADVRTVAALLAKGASIEARDINGFLPLHVAARGGNAEVISFLLKKGADVAATESHGGTPLHLAAMDGKVEAARVLLAHGAPPAALDQYKNSPLQLAAGGGGVEIVRLLLDHGVPVNTTDLEGSTALHAATVIRIGRNDFSATAGLPQESMQASAEAVKKSRAADKVKIVRLLLEKGADPQVKNLEGATPIDFAIKFGTPEIVDLLKSRALPAPLK